MYLYSFKRRPLTHRKRRIRKKYRIGEFTEYGFNIDALFAAGVTDEDGKILDAAITQIESMNLCCGGGCSNEAIHLFVSPTRRCTTATLADCEAIREWLLANPSIDHVDIGPLVDAWWDEKGYQ